MRERLNVFFQQLTHFARFVLVKMYVMLVVLSPLSNLPARDNININNNKHVNNNRPAPGTTSRLPSGENVRRRKKKESDSSIHILNDLLPAPFCWCGHMTHHMHIT